MPTARDPRWIVLAESGHYFNISRHREPDKEDITGAENALIKASSAGWLAIMSHSIYEDNVPEVVMVRPLCNPQASFEEAVRAFELRLKESKEG
ncbi:MAG: hypothetical protein P4L50_11205 [Anaerolineaceae bacterium]|nr:hypothetical protein [Anaerolineaceae bacterium]